MIQSYADVVFLENRVKRSNEIETHCKKNIYNSLNCIDISKVLVVLDGENSIFFLALLSVAVSLAHTAPLQNVQTIPLKRLRNFSVYKV